MTTFDFFYYNTKVRQQYYTDNINTVCMCRTTSCTWLHKDDDVGNGKVCDVPERKKNPLITKNGYTMAIVPSKHTHTHYTLTEWLVTGAGTRRAKRKVMVESLIVLLHELIDIGCVDNLPSVLKPRWGLRGKSRTHVSCFYSTIQIYSAEDRKDHVQQIHIWQKQEEKDGVYRCTHTVPLTLA